jgi:hypothetical protein
MFGDGKNLKDENTTLGIVLKDNNTPISYTKTNKLITALYMVTDIMDKEEPLRNKLRTLGANIISDIYSSSARALPKISEIMSFLDVAETVNLISEMNSNILRKEFFELKQSIEDSIQLPKPSYSEVNLSDLFKTDFSLPSERMTSTRLGVQKGSTLLKALNNVRMPSRNSLGKSSNMSIKKTKKPSANFEVLKGHRRDEIIAIIKVNPDGATITDIKNNAKGHLASCGDKTLQRELTGMVKDGVLKKTGEKRWSKYSIA